MEEQKDNATSVKSIEDLKQQRENKLKRFWTSPLIFIPIIILLICLGVWIRMMPLADHSGRPGLIDISTGGYTLGPDLDPFLFLRYAKEIDATGGLPVRDMLRYVPLGAQTAYETTLLPYFIYYTHEAISWILDTLSPNNPNFDKYKTVDFGGVMFPVIAFAFTIIAFFLFVYVVFSGKTDDPDSNRKKMFAGCIATISTFIMIVAPSFLARTIAGIPEKESSGFLWLFLSLYFFILSMKEDKLWKIITFGFLAGATTAIMGAVWGGFIYVYATLGLAALIGFIINKLSLEHKIGYIAWFSSSTIIIQMLTARFSLYSLVGSINTAVGALAFLIISFSIFIDQLKKKGLEKYIGFTWLKTKIKLPENLIIILISLVIAFIGILVVFGPDFVLRQGSVLNNMLFNPSVSGRWGMTVAENQQPYFVQWVGNFGQYAFIIFFLGSILFYWNLLGTTLYKKEKMMLAGMYVLFFFGLVFSRYAPHPALFDGENFISKAMYILTTLIFFGSLIYFYIKGERENRKVFEQVNIEWLILLMLFVLALFGARSAVRLVMVLAIIAPILTAYFICQLGVSAIWGDPKKKIAYWLTFIIITLFMAYTVSGYYISTTSQAYNYVPYYYTYQWQEAMSWVRTATPTTAVFAHWWDYGYWVQSIGERATFTDGGNYIIWWNYLTGRFVLTGDNQKDSLEVLYAHNVTHLLIDSSDISKYGAFSQIGSDINFDRLSYGPVTMSSDQKMIQENKNGYTRVYQGTMQVDEDISYNGTHLFSENSAIIGMELRTNNGTYAQPIGIYYNYGQSVRVPLRYIYYNGNITDFGSGIEAAAYPIQNIIQGANNQLSIDPDGGVMYLSPRILRGFLGQVYILNDPFNKFPAFKTVHVQPDYILQMISAQNGIQLGDFAIYQGLKGPIKIWNITYPSDIKFIDKYASPVLPAEINWQF
jgi:asparagine N-glycosylation enzyme membrane subunit Stt3